MKLFHSFHSWIMNNSSSFSTFNLLHIASSHHLLFKVCCGSQEELKGLNTFGYKTVSRFCQKQHLCFWFTEESLAKVTFKSDLHTLCSQFFPIGGFYQVSDMVRVLRASQMSCSCPIAGIWHLKWKVEHYINFAFCFLQTAFGTIFFKRTSV